MAHNTVCRSGADVPNATPESTGFYNSVGVPIAAGILYPKFGVLLSPIFPDLLPLLTWSKSLCEPSRSFLNSSMRCSAGRTL